MEKLDYVKKHLQEIKEDKSQNLDRVAYLSSISRRTIANIMAGKDARISTINALFNFLKQDKQQKGKK